MNLPKTKKEQDIFLKKIFDYCMSVKWQKAKLEELATDLNVDRYQIREWARKYVREHFKGEEYKKIDKEINRLTILDRENTKLKLTKINPILLEQRGKSTYQLWETDEEKEFVLKYIYDYCDEVQFDKEKIEQFATWLGTTTHKIEEYFKLYTINYLKWSREQHHQKRMEYGHKNSKTFYKKRETKSKIIYDALLNATSLEEIIKILDTPEVNLDSIRNGLINYVIVHHNGNEKIREELKTKIKMYIDYISNQQREKKQRKKQLSKELDKQKQIPIAIATIKAFVNDLESNTIDFFCKKNNISKTDFTNYVSLVAEIDLELFKRYDSKILNAQRQRYNILVKQIKQIIMYLKIGIEEYGVVRPFDLIDYFLITKISLKDILKFSKEIITQNESNLLRKFVS